MNFPAMEKDYARKTVVGAMNLIQGINVKREVMNALIIRNIAKTEASATLKMAASAKSYSKVINVRPQSRINARPKMISAKTTPFVMM